MKRAHEITKDEIDEHSDYHELLALSLRQAYREASVEESSTYLAASLQGKDVSDENELVSGSALDENDDEAGVDQIIEQIRAAAEQAGATLEKVAKNLATNWTSAAPRYGRKSGEPLSSYDEERANRVLNGHTEQIREMGVEASDDEIARAIHTLMSEYAPERLSAGRTEDGIRFFEDVVL